MAKNVLVLESDDHGQFFLSIAGKTLTLGEQPGRGEVLLDDLHIKRIRCEIEIDEHSIVLSKPAGPGGQPATRRELRPGQGVRLGHSRIRFEERDEEEEETTLEPSPASAASTVANTPIVGAAGQGTFRRFRVIDGADLGRAFRLPETGSLAIGKSAKHADIVLHDLYVARVHCVVEVGVGKIVVRHNEGDNGTLINAKRITDQQEIHLGDVLRVGNSHLRLETALTLDSSSTGKDEDEESSPPPRVAGEEDGTSHTASATEQPHEFAGRVMGNYRIIGLLGTGHSGEVFRAQDIRNNLVVSLKVLSPSFPADGQELQKFVQVLKVATQLHHPNLVTLYTAGRSGSHCWIAREHVEGESAADLVPRLTDRGKINWTRAGRVAVHMARALTFLHQHRHVHGNVTLANILLGKDRSTRLADTMLDKSLEGSKLQEAIVEQKLLAELAYLAPEQTDPGAFVDNLADLYGLGAVLFTLLTGQPPFQGASPEEIIEQIRKTPVVRPTTLQRKIPPEFEAVVLKLMAKHQEDRYQTAADLLATVEAIAKKHEIEV